MLTVEVPFSSTMTEEQLKETMLRATMEELTKTLLTHLEKGDEVSMEQFTDNERVHKYAFKIIMKAG